MGSDRWEGPDEGHQAGSPSFQNSRTSVVGFLYVVKTHDEFLEASLNSG